MSTLKLLYPTPEEQLIQLPYAHVTRDGVLQVEHAILHRPSSIVRGTQTPVRTIPAYIRRPFGRHHPRGIFNSFLIDTSQYSDMVLLSLARQVLLDVHRHASKATVYGRSFTLFSYNVHWNSQPVDEYILRTPQRELLDYRNDLFFDVDNDVIWTTDVHYLRYLDGEMRQMHRLLVRGLPITWPGLVLDKGTA